MRGKKNLNSAQIPAISQLKIPFSWQLNNSTKSLDIEIEIFRGQ